MASFDAAETQAAKKHNKGVLRSAKKGDLLEFPRALYSHWAVYVGNGRIIHLAGEPEDAWAPADVSVRESSFWTVARTSLTKINNSFDRTERPLPPEEIVERAMSKIGERGFSLLFTNCEHFVTWCRYGKARSSQVESFDQFLTAFGTGWKLGLTMVAHGHQDEKQRQAAEKLLTFGQMLGQLKDAYFQANRDDQLGGLTSVQKYNGI